MNIYIKLIIGAAVFDMILYWVKYQMYYRVLWLCKYTRIRYVSALEYLLYEIQAMSRKIPFLLIKCNEYDMNDADTEIRQAMWKGEKLLIALEYFLALLHKVVGVRIIYVVCLLIYVWTRFEQQIINVLMGIFDNLIVVDYIALFQNIYDYIWANGSGILVAIIITLIVYIHYLKDKHSRYVIENIWNDDTVRQNQEVAKAQKNIKMHIVELYKKLVDNMRELKCVIDKMDRWYKYGRKVPLDVDSVQFVEYEGIVKDIKEEIRGIEDNEGMPLYLEFNQKIWWQLYQLSLTSSDDKFYHILGISNCDKKSLERVLKDETINEENYRDKRKLLMMYWVDAIACLNGIERYLKYIKKRERKFTKINKKLSKVGAVRETLENVKANVE